MAPRKQTTRKRAATFKAAANGKRFKAAEAPIERRALLDGQTIENPFVDLPDTAVSRIVGYVDISSLFRLSQVSKALVQSKKNNSKIITYEHVVRSAFAARGSHHIISSLFQHHDSLGCIVELLKNDSIYVPSVGRLLRLLVSARGCEICGKARNVRDKRSWENGVAMCRHCMPRFIGYRYSYIPCLRHPCLAGRLEKTRIIILVKPFQTLTGEWAGSIFTYRDIYQRSTRKPPQFEQAALKKRDTQRNVYRGYREQIIQVAEQCYASVKQRKKSTS